MTRDGKKKLGSGEFSDVFLIGKDNVMKVSRSSSLHGRDIPNFEKIAREELAEEVKTYKSLKKIPNVVRILPKNMTGRRKGDKFVIVREGGEIPKVDESCRNYCDWKKGKVTERQFQSFANKIYKIAQVAGFFADGLQPAIRDDGTLFLTDLGHFVTHKESPEYSFFAPDYKKGESKPFVKDEAIEKSYDEAKLKLKHFSQQLGMKEPDIPSFVKKDMKRIVTEKYAGEIEDSKKRNLGERHHEWIREKMKDEMDRWKV